jgi:hypothetical protein
MPQLQQKEFQTTFTHLSPKNRQAIRTRQLWTNTNRKTCLRQEPHWDLSIKKAKRLAARK